MFGRIIFLTILALLFGGPSGVTAQSLSGSARSLDRQNSQARSHDFSYLRDSRQLQRFVSLGLLVRVRSDRNAELHAVSFPYTRPEVKTFIDRLSGQYRRACGEKLVVTSLTRPISRQPRNASSRSVHPTGMAVDLRRSTSRACRAWLERVLVSLEAQGVLEATRERRPPHYHVAVFPQAYRRYVDQLLKRNSARAARVAESVSEYRVRRGDSLWTIARDHGTTVSRLQQINDLGSSRIFAGQTLRVPTDP